MEETKNPCTETFEETLAVDRVEGICPQCQHENTLIPQFHEITCKCTYCNQVVVFTKSLPDEKDREITRLRAENFRLKLLIKSNKPDGSVLQ
jgi:hypothetical protein